MKIRQVVLAVFTAFIVVNGHRVKRTTLEDRANCGEGDDVPVNRLDTSARVAALRQQMTANGLSAYIIPMDDSHQSEYVSEHDMRVLFISGFTGSAGRAVVTQNAQALWTDGRYFLQAEDQLDCNWILMREGEAGTPEIEDWLAEVLSANDIVGADDRMLSYDRWQIIADALESADITIQPAQDLVDNVWESEDMPERPAQVQNPIIIHPVEYAGQSWQDKVNRVREAIAGIAVAAVFTALDETAWLFNLRGNDIDYNPVFFSYSMVDEDSVTLFIQDPSTLLDANLTEHLNTGSDGVCSGGNGDCVTVGNYEDFATALRTRADALGADERIWISPMSGFALYSGLGNAEERQARAYLEPTVIRLMKARKNEVEKGHLRECYKKDSAALIEFMAHLESGVKAGEPWDEISASDELAHYREDIDTFMGLSFGTISGFGANGAIIHYSATEETNVDITTDGMYLLDSGGQYLDGTTDVTRTFHFGTPTEEHRTVYTRVLMGSIDLALAVWANGTYGRDFDALARAPLWAAGLDYNHGTGHGIGMFLHVHEGPARIRIGLRPLDHETPIYGDMMFSDEPGYYKDGEFGVRLETIVISRVEETEFRFEDNDYLGFEILTLVPFEPHLIDYSLLSERQIDWLNDYNQRCLTEIGENILLAKGNQEAYDWIVERTQPIERGDPSSASSFGLFYVTLLAAFGAVKMLSI